MSRAQRSFLCDLCAALFTEDKGVRDAELASGKPLVHRDVRALEASAEKGCSLCLTILRGFPPQERAWAHRYLNLAEENATMEDPRGMCEFKENVNDMPGYDLNLYYRYLPPNEGEDYDIHLVRVSLIPYEALSLETQLPNCHSSNLLGYGESFKMVSQWLATCDSLHSCRSLVPTSAPFHPTRLLHVGNAANFDDLYLCESDNIPQDAQYLTLSHCWGLKPIAKLVDGVLSAFTKKVPWKELPLSFQEAIMVTRNLKIQFLWIDSLCIIQDNEEDWLRESLLMSEVYSNSYLNLAAAASANSYGGLFKKRMPQSAKPCLIDLKWMNTPGPPAGLFYCCQPDEWENQVGGSPLYLRGWVCQEKLLAPRVLNFAQDQLYWECNEMNSSEAWPAGVPPNTIIVFNKGILREIAQNKDPSILFHAWNLVLRHYSAGALTKSADKLIAISGIVRYFIAQGILKEEDYLAGLWRPTLPQALMWKGPYMAGRPGGSTQLYGVRPQPYRAPSWSWASIDWTITPATAVSEPEKMVELIDTSTTSAFGPLGLVVSGAVRIRGFPFRAELKTASERFAMEDSCRLFLAGDEISDSTGRLDEANTLPGSKFEVHCMPFKLRPISEEVSQIWVQGLLLQPTGRAAGQFKRIGVFDVFRLQGFEQFMTGLRENPYGEPEYEERMASEKEMGELCAWQNFFPDGQFPEPEAMYTISIV